MKLGTHVLSEFLNRTASIFFWPNQPKKHFIEIFQNAKNLTFGSGTANTAPAHPHRRGPLYLSDFFSSIFDNDLSTSNKCHFQTVKARATGLRSYERSFNVVLGSHKIFYIISS